MREPVEQRILAIIAENLETRPDALTPDSNPDSVEKWDSTNHMKMVIGLEGEFGIEFDEIEIIELLTVGQVIEAVRNKLA